LFEGLVQYGETGISDDALAVLEPFAVKVAWAVLWGRGGSDAVSLPTYSDRLSSLRS
jgi:hypothetical protein